MIIQLSVKLQTLKCCGQTVSFFIIWSQKRIYYKNQQIELLEKACSNNRMNRKCVICQIWIFFHDHLTVIFYFDNIIYEMNSIRISRSNLYLSEKDYICIVSTSTRENKRIYFFMCLSKIGGCWIFRLSYHVTELNIVL